MFLCRNTTRELLFATWLAFATSVHAQNQNLGYTLEIVPPAAVGSEAIIARISAGDYCAIDPATLAVTGDQAGIRIDVLTRPNCLTGPPPTYHLELGRFPAGNYPVRLMFGTAQVGAATIDVAAPASKTAIHPLVDYTDHWWNAQEPGWGMSIMQHHPSDRVFAVWYVYDQSRQSVWYTLQPGQWLDFMTYAGPVYKTTGPYFGVAFDPKQVGITMVGTATLKFTDSGTGTFDYVIEGVTGTKSITRMPF